METGLQGKVAFLTGGSKGLGRVIATALAREGMRVAIVSRSLAPLQEAAKEIQAETGSEVVAFPGDLTSAADVDQVVAQVIAQFGGIDVLVNCAGNAPPGLLEELSEEDWDVAFALKFRGYLRTLKAILPHMAERGGGRVVNVIGNDGTKPIFHELPGTAVNAADIAVTFALAEQYGPKQVRINGICPGPMPTTRWDRIERHFADWMGISMKEARERAIRSIPIGRFPELEEVADLVVYLASDRSSYLTGQIINVDGHQFKSLLHG